jgi:hypothetical protein
MSKLNKWGVGAVAALAVTGLAFAAVPAQADPSGLPTFRTLAGVGSDTTQDLNNGLASVVTIGGQRVLGSYDATGTSPIQTKASGSTFARPNGSSQGFAALKSAKESTLWDGQDLPADTLQFARSSSGATWATGGKYSYIPLALDAVTYATASTEADVPTNLTIANLTAIYSAADGALVTIGGQSYEVGNEANADADIRPYLPQTGSGTRSFWLGQLGLTEADVATSTNSAVEWSYTGGSVQEHDGSVLADVDNAIVPFSIAQHIAQGNKATIEATYPGVTVANRLHGAALRSVNGVAPEVSGVLNTAFPISRPVFTVVEYAELATNSTLSAVFEGPSGLAYDQDVIADFGFGDLSTGVTIGADTYVAGDAESFRRN